MRAFAQRALLELLNVAAVVYRVGCAFKSEKKRAFSVHITQILRRSRAKETQNFQNFGAPRAQNLRALDQRAF